MSDESTKNRYGFLNQKSQARSQSEVSGVDSVYVHDICQRIEGYQQKIENLGQTPNLPNVNPNVKLVLAEAISVLGECIAKMNEQLPENANHLHPSNP